MALKRITALILAIVMTIGMFPVYTSAEEGASTAPVILYEGTPEETVLLPQGDYIHLAVEAEENAAFQWQIKAAEKLWVDISNATEATLRVSCSMVASLLKEDAAYLRCTVTDSEGKSVQTDPVQVQVSKEPMETPAVFSFRRPIAPDPLPAPVAVKNTPARDAQDETIPETVPQTTPATIPETVPTTVPETIPEETVKETLPLTTEPAAVETEATEETQAVKETAPAETAPEATEETRVRSSASAPPVMLSAGIANEDVAIYTVTIEYVYAADSKFAGQRVALPYIAEVSEGDSLNDTVISPNCVGYTPDIKEIDLSDLGAITGNISRTVSYSPATVSYTVRHYQQNIDDDEYTWVDTTLTPGKTEDLTSDNAAKSYTGFTALSHYHEEIAADSSTTIDIYYDRNYYLMSFELDGGYGTEPVYARYGAEMKISNNPSRAGYEFGGWKDRNGNITTIPKTMPSESVTYYAYWISLDSEYSAVYWVNNDDGTKTYLTTRNLPAKSGDTVSGKDDVCGSEYHVHTTDCNITCTTAEHTHTTACFSNISFNSNITNNSDMNAILAANGGMRNIEGTYLYLIQTATDVNQGRYWCKMLVNGRYWNISINKSDPIYNLGSVVTGNADKTGTVNGYTAYRYPVNQINRSYITCGSVEHIHGDACSTCGKTEHIHTDACKPDVSKYLEYVDSQQNVTVQGDGTTAVNVYYKYRTYTIRYIYARKNSSGTYQIATLTRAGGFDDCEWTSIGTNASVLPNFEDPSGVKERSSFVHSDGCTYYFISLTAKYGADISGQWPDANIGSVSYNNTTYDWGSWAAAPDTGYRETYGDDHANIVGVYPVMSADMIVDDQELLETKEDGTKVYLAQNMIAWWASSNIGDHAYHNYFEVIGAAQAGDVEYNGKYYRLEENLSFTLAHNDYTRVDPIAYNGFTCINDTRGTNDDKQSNSKNYPNNGNCTICGDRCAYCNSFYYDRNVHYLKFWNHNNWLTNGDGVPVAYGTPLEIYEKGTDANPGATARAQESYPSTLEAEVYEFEGWYTTAECHEDTKVLWTSATMPDSDLTMYANWVPITRNVSVYKTENGDQIGADIQVPNGTLVPEASRPETPTPPNEGDTFLGWFYRDEKGQEQAFSFATMAITQDMTVYAKWRSNVMKEVVIHYVVEDESGNRTPIADSETLMLRVGQIRTFDAKTGLNLYEEYRSGCFPTTATHSITPTETSTEEELTYTFVYKQYGKVPYQVVFSVEEDGEKRPAFRKDENGKAVFMETYDADADVYTEQHWDNDKAVVTELYVPDDLAVSTWVLPDEYLPNALKIQKIIIPNTTNPESNIGANTIEFVYTYTKPETDPDNPGTPVYKARYLVQHYIENTDYLLADEEDRENIDQYILYRYSDNEGISGQEASADAISIPGYTYSSAVTEGNMQDGTTLNGDTMSGTIASDDSLELNFYYTVNTYPYQVMYLEENTNRVLLDAKTHEGNTQLTGLYGAKVTENAVTIDGYDVDAQSKSIYIQQEAGTAASINTIVFYYSRKSANLIITKTVAMDEEQAEHEDITGLPQSVLNQEFEFVVTAKKGFHKSVYDYVVYDVTKNENGTVTETKAKEGKATASTFVMSPITIKNGQKLVIEDLSMGDYTVTETHVVGFRTSVDGTIKLAHDVKLETAGSNVKVDYVNTFPFYTGDLVVMKEVNKDEADPAGTHRVRITLNPARETREIDRVITFVNKAGEAYQENGSARTFTVPALTKNSQTSFEIIVDVPAGDEVKLVGAPAGTFTAEEIPTGSDADITNYYGVISKAVVHQNDTPQFTKAARVESEIHGGHPTAVIFRNTYKKGALTINKTVTQEYANDNWQSDTFTFTLTGKTELPAGSYAITVGGAASTATVDADGNIVLSDNPTIVLSKDADSTATEWEGSITLTGLPAGYYTVTESDAANGLEKYTLVPETGKHENLLVNDPAAPAEAAFTNTYKRTKGNLQVGKEIRIVTAGSIIDENQAFTFEVMLKDTDLTGSFDCQVKNTNGTTDTSDDFEVTGSVASLTADSRGILTFNLKHNQYILIEGLPVGDYLVKELAVEGYDSSFGDVTVSAGDYSVDPATITTGQTTVLNCQNAYPVYYSNLIVSKTVVTSDDHLALDQAPENDAFTYTVSISHYSDKVNLANGITAKFYDSPDDTEPDERSLTVANNVLTFQLKHGQWIDLNLPACTYTIAETGLSSSVNTDVLTDHYTTAYTVGSTAGVPGERYTLVSGETETVTFTNAYKRHLTELTINKTGASKSDENQSFIFNVTSTSLTYGGNAVDLRVVITIPAGATSGSVTLTDMPLGSYTIAEEESWSWRYNDGCETITLGDQAAYEVTINNTRTNPYWLSGADANKNIFDGTP